MFVDTHPSEAPNTSGRRLDPESLLKMIEETERAKLRIYIGAAAGVGKTFQLLEDAHILKKEGIDVVIGAIETHGRKDTVEQIGDLEAIPPIRREYRGAVFSEMDLAGIIRRKPAVAVVDELAHSNIEGSEHEKRYQDVLELLENGISVITAVNIQHIESLNDVITQTTGVRVRETVPDTFFSRADEIIDVDVNA